MYQRRRYGRVAFVGLPITLGHRGAIASDAVGFTRARAGVNALRRNSDDSYNVYDHYNQLHAIRFAKDVSDLAVLHVHSHEDPALFQAHSGRCRRGRGDRQPSARVNLSAGAKGGASASE